MKEETTILKCCQLVAMDKYSYPGIDWEKFYKRDMMYSIVEELDRQGYIDWKVEVTEEDKMTLFTRYTAQLNVIPLKPSQASQKGSNFDSNLIDGQLSHPE